MSISHLDVPQQHTSCAFSVPWTLESNGAGQPSSNESLAPASKAGTAGSQATILLFGHDPILLKTRQWILARHGYRCGTAMEIDEVRRCFAETPIRLLILCYSLPEYDCDEAIELANSRPATQSLVLVYGNTNCAMDESSAVLNVLDGPAALVTLVDKLLQSPNLTHEPTHDS